MRTPLAWQNLTYEKTRLVVAIAGVAFAVILMFMNLGFLGSLELTASLVYNKIDADIFLISPQALELSTTKSFPIDRLYQVAGIAGVDRVMPLYLGYLQWRNPMTHQSRALFVYAFNPNDPVFLLPELRSPENQAALRRWDTVLIDRFSRPEYGPQAVGTITETARRRVEIGGQYALGNGFAADGSLMMSDLNYRRYFTRGSLDRIDLGLIKLQPGANVTAIAAEFDRTLPPDVLVLTQAQIVARDRAYWIDTTSTGFIFTLGVMISLVVGTVIVYQILYTDITSHIKQYGTLKAMGYSGFFLCKVVLEEAVILAVLGYIPGFAISLGLYDLTVRATSGGLPIAMNIERIVLVFVLTLSMCAVSGLISIQKVIAADPAEVF